MNAKLMDSWSRLEAQTKEMIKSQEELKENIRELEAAIAAEGGSPRGKRNAKRRLYM